MSRTSRSVLLIISSCSLSTVASFGFFNYIPPPAPIFQPSPVEAAVCRPWTCHGATNRELINNLAMGKIIKSKEVRDAMLLVDRVNYMAPDQRPAAYDDAPRSIGYGQTISAPHMHAHALEELLPALKNAKLNDGEQTRILDVGSGSGYLTACFGRLLSVLQRDDGKVFGIDYIPELVDMSRKNIQKEDGDLLSSRRVSISVGDGWKGLPSEGPFHAIHVGAGAETLPKDLAMQLAVGGRMVCPIKTPNGYQMFYRIDRIKPSVAGVFEESDFQFTELFPVTYVPLVHPR